jgi:hypothetical protein
MLSFTCRHTTVFHADRAKDLHGRRQSATFCWSSDRFVKASTMPQQAQTSIYLSEDWMQEPAIAVKLPLKCGVPRHNGTLVTGCVLVAGSPFAPYCHQGGCCFILNTINRHSCKLWCASSCRCASLVCRDHCLHSDLLLFVSPAVFRTSTK